MSLSECRSNRIFRLLELRMLRRFKHWYVFDTRWIMRIEMITAIKNVFNLFVFALVISALVVNPVGAQDLFEFPDEDPAADKAEADDPKQEEEPAAGENPPDDKNPLKSEDEEQDPLLKDDEAEQDPLKKDDQEQKDGEPVPMEKDPLLDGDDDELVVRPQQGGGAGEFQDPGDEDSSPGQSVVVNSKFAGWEQAGPSSGGRRLSKELRANWIMVNANGRFTGQVLPAKDASVEDMIVYLVQSGRVNREARIDKNGMFEFSNIAEGPYALVGWGDNAFFAFGLNILEFDDQKISKVRNNVRVKAIQNKTTLNTDWIRHFTPKVSFRIFGRYEAAEGVDDPPSLYGIEGLSENLPDAEAATSIDSRPVTRTASGGMIGRVHLMNTHQVPNSLVGLGRPVDVRGTRIILLQEDEVVAATDADNYGVFFFPNVEVGEYGLLAAGADGAGLIGIDVIDNEEEEEEAEEETVIMNEEGELVDEKGKEKSKPKKQEPFPFDFCLVSAETLGWMNHNATELAYRRNLLAPRRPKLDGQNQICRGCEGSGCQHCKGTGLCTSRCQSFEDWAMNCRDQHQKTKLGSGYVLSEASKDVRRLVDRSNNYFEKAFYGGTDNQQFDNLNGAGFQNGNGGGYQNGYQNGYQGGYQNGNQGGYYNDGSGGMGTGMSGGTNPR